MVDPEDSQPTFRPTPPITIGVLGGIASGKSTVTKLFEARGLVRIDADEVARRVVAATEILDRVRARYGDEVFDGDALDRAKLAKRVFGDRKALDDLEAITHPWIRDEITRRLDEALAAGSSCVLDVPLLYEGGLIERCDACVFVEADEDVRRERARARGWDDGELARREANQADLDAKRAACGYNVRSSGSLEQARRDVEAVLARLADD